MSPAPVAPLAVRLTVLALAAALLEIVGVSQISVFGVSADLTPLVVMCAGLLCGSIAGAVVGFGMGLFLDLVLVETLGLTSLVLCVAGYWAGRLRELRTPPQGALTLIATGAGMTAAVEGGYAIAQFLLGVDAPVSFLLVREIVTTILVNALLAPAVFALARRWLTPTLPGGAGLRRREPARRDARGRGRRRRGAYAPGPISPLS